MESFPTASSAVPFCLRDILAEYPGVRFLGIREAKYYRRNPKAIPYTWTVNRSGLHLPIYFLGDCYTTRNNREYGVSLTQTHIGWKRGFVPLDVLIGGLGEYPKIPIYK